MEVRSKGQRYGTRDRDTKGESENRGLRRYISEQRQLGRKVLFNY